MGRILGFQCLRIASTQTYGQTFGQTARFAQKISLERLICYAFHSSSLFYWCQIAIKVRCSTIQIKLNLDDLHYFATAGVDTFLVLQVVPVLGDFNLYFRTRNMIRHLKLRKYVRLIEIKKMCISIVCLSNLFN